MKIKTIHRGKWIGGIPDSLTLPCGICGKKVDYDFQVDDELWDNIVPKKYRRGVLCLKCLDLLASKQNIDISKHLKKVYYCGENKTIELKPGIEYRWEKAK